MVYKTPARKGIALILVIIIMVVAAIVVFGIASYISNSLALNIAKVSREQAIFAAQAGIYASIYDYNVDPSQPYWSKITSQNLSDNIYYSAGRDADFLLTSAANTRLSGNRTLQNFALGNINATQPIIINSVKVEWTGFAGNLTQIYLGGSTRWSGSASPGTFVTLASPFTINAKELFAKEDDNSLTFSRNIAGGSSIVATFRFDYGPTPAGDGSSRKAMLYGTGKKNEFSVTSTGEVRGSINWKRTLEATYDACAGVITSWQEVDSHI